MAQIKKKNLTPPGGWVFKETSGFVISGSSEALLVENVIRHRKATGNPGSQDPSEVLLEVNRQLCSTLDNSWCKPEDGEDYQPIVDRTRVFKLDQISSLTQTGIAHIKNGLELADMETVAKRAAICRGCHLNKPANACLCDTLYKTVEKLIPTNRKMPDMDVCGACGCLINAKIQMPQSVIEEGNKGKNLRFPSHCWQNPTSNKPKEVKKAEIVEEPKPTTDVKVDEDPKPVAKKKPRAKKKAARKKRS